MASRPTLGGGGGALLLAVVCCCSVASHGLLLQDDPTVATTVGSAGACTAYYIEQYVDHFNWGKLGGESGSYTFQQRYFLCSEHWRQTNTNGSIKSGPIFFYFVRLFKACLRIVLLISSGIVASLPCWLDTFFRNQAVNSLPAVGSHSLLTRITAALTRITRCCACACLFP